MAGFSAGSASVPIVPDFRGAQKAISEWFGSQGDMKVRVTPDIDQTRVAAQRAEIEGHHATLHVDIDKDHLRQSFLSAVDQLTGLSTVQSAFEKLFGPKSILVTSGVGALTALASSASQAGGAIGLLPAGLAAVAGAAATVAVGVQGIGAAWKAWDPNQSAAQAKKAQEALAGLAPSARDFVVQLHSLSSGFHDLRLDVQQHLFEGLGTTVADLARTYLPVLRVGMDNVATGLNAVVKNIATVLNTQANTKLFADTWTNIGAMFKNLAPAAGGFAQILLTVTSVGSQFLPGIATSLSSIVTRWQQWVQQAAATGQLNSIIRTSLDTLRELGQIVGNLGGFLVNVFRAALPAGNELMGVLLQLSKYMKDLTGSTAGQTALRSFFDSIGSAVKSLLPGVEAIVNALVTGVLPSIGHLAAALAPVVSGVLVQFAAMLKTIAPLIYPALANAIAVFVGAMAPLIPDLTKVAQVLFPALSRVLKEVSPAIGEITSVIGGALVSAVRILTPMVEWLALHLLPPLAAVLKFLAPALGPLAAFILGVAAALKVWTAIQLLLNIAIETTPIGWIITGIGLLVVAIVEIATHLDFFKNLWNTVWTAVKDFFTTIWNAIKDFFIAIVTAVKDFFTAFLQATARDWQATWTAIRDFFLALWSALVSFWTNSLNATKDFFVAVWTAIRDFFVAIWTGIRDFAVNTWNAISNFLRTAFTDFATFFSTVWTGIKNGFLGIWQGMVDGVKIIWEAIKAVFAIPINFVINTILNGGLFKAWNWIVDTLHLPGNWKLHVDPIPGYQRGGYTGDDPADVPAGVVHGQEFVFTARQTRRAGPQRLQAYADALDNGPGYKDGGYVDPALVRALPGFAGGGVVPGAMTWSELWATIHGAFPNSVLTSAYRPGASDYHGLGDAIDVSFPGNPQSLLMPLAAWIAQKFPYSTELIHNPNGSIKNGQAVPPGFWGAETWQQHINHVHWAMTPDALAKGGAPGGQSLIAPVIGFFGEVWNSITDVLGDLTKSIVAPIDQMFSLFAHSPVTEVLAGMGKGLVGGIWDATKGAIGDALTSMLGGGLSSGGGDVKTEALNIAAQMFGWKSTSDRNGLDFIAQHESGWNPKAQNPSSSASGIWQLIDSTWRGYRAPIDSKYAHAKDAPPAQQDQAAFKYIKAAYGNPTDAAAHWQSVHSYDTGGWLPPGISTIYNGTGRPEPVLTAREHDALRAWQAAWQHRGDRDGSGMRDVHFHGIDRDSAREMMNELWHHLQVNRRGGVYSSPTTVYVAG